MPSPTSTLTTVATASAALLSTTKSAAPAAAMAAQLVSTAPAVPTSTVAEIRNWTAAPTAKASRRQAPVAGSYAPASASCDA